MRLPLSMLLPGLAPDLAWCLGMDVPKACRAEGGHQVLEGAKPTSKEEVRHD